MKLLRNCVEFFDHRNPLSIWNTNVGFALICILGILALVLFYASMIPVGLFIEWSLYKSEYNITTGCKYEDEVCKYPNQLGCSIYGYNNRTGHPQRALYMGCAATGSSIIALILASMGAILLCMNLVRKVKIELKIVSDNYHKIQQLNDSYEIYKKDDIPLDSVN